MATNNQNIESRDSAPAAALNIEPVELRMTGLMAKPAPVPKKFAGKPVANLKTEFSEARGKIPTEKTPSLAQALIITNPVDKYTRDKERLFQDISVARLNGSDDEASGITKARNDLRDEAEGSYRYGYESSGVDYGSSDYASEDFWQQEVSANNDYMYELQNDLWDNESRQAELLATMQQDSNRLEVLETERATLLNRKEEIANESEIARQSLIDAEKFAAEAGDRLAKKIEEKYPDGKEPAGNEPDPVRDAEKKLHDEAYDKHRDEIQAFYKEKGLEQEFLTLQKPVSGGEAEQAEIQAALAKIQNAGLPYDPDIKLVELVRRDEPDSPYLQTLHAARVDVENSWDKTVKAQTFADVQRKEAEKEIKEINERLEAMDPEMKALMEKGKENEKELKKLQDDHAALTQKLQQAKDYDTWLNSPETKDKLKAGTLTYNDFETKAPKFMDGWIDYNNQCVNPNSDLGQELAAKATDPQASSRVGTSAASSNIEAPPAKVAFNTAAPPSPEAAPAPAPAMPTPETQKPAAAAPAAPAP